MVYRIYVEKKAELAHEAHTLFGELCQLVGIKGLEGVRILNRYDVENIDGSLFDKTVGTVFSEPQLDVVTTELDARGGKVFGWVAFLSFMMAIACVVLFIYQSRDIYGSETLFAQSVERLLQSI